MGEFYAKAYFDKLGKKEAVLYGPAYKGISLSISAAVALSKNGLNVPFFFNRKEVKDHGEGGTFVGYVPQAGEEIVIIEDVITAGTAIRESMEILSHLQDTKVIATLSWLTARKRARARRAQCRRLKNSSVSLSTLLLMFMTSLSTWKRTRPTLKMWPALRIIWP